MLRTEVMQRAKRASKVPLIVCTESVLYFCGCDLRGISDDSTASFPLQRSGAGRQLPHLAQGNY